MANLKEIRNRISSVSSTMQITSAMKMVSAAKLKKAQDAITAMRPYSDKLTQMLVNLSSSVDFENVYLSPRKVKNKLIVCVTSNRGLCGAFNSNVIKKCTEIANSSDESVSFLCIGKKGADILSKNYNVVQTNNEIFDDLTFENISAIAEKLMSMFLNKEFDSVQIVYNKFKNAATQIVIQEQYLPIENNDSENDQKESSDYIFEPSQVEIISELIPKSLKTQLYKSIRDSYASEHGARMTAMHKATDNATELRDQLKLTYNKARQAAITNEILEIVGGAEALNG
ncbi:MAG: ATP synthase F1 subunit gamma [Flavobacteriaceae bacterium]|mgnify:FL=1|jgi:F-type H+-transporting ATPase subunit gamma|nr:ATP synthase F1 subunit gamma [Flavobacteriaceae bacterium]|tara:strand:+ start:2894 stop:3748 length:855 start_codon:yes stop_codon:yes gene_type:complete